MRCRLRAVRWRLDPPLRGRAPRRGPGGGRGRRWLLTALVALALAAGIVGWLQHQLRPLVEAAARADFVIGLYNPASKGRPDYVRQACSRILKYRPGHTVCGLAVNIGREGEGMEVLALEDLKERRVDMFTTVYIGNSHTRQIGPYMVTPRGYRYEGN